MTQEQYILSTFGPDDGKEINAAVAQEFSKLCALCEGESKARAKTMREKILPRIAMYKILSDRMSKEDAYGKVWDYTKTCICAPSSRHLRKLQGLPFFFALFKAVFFRIVSTSDRWITTVSRNEKDGFFFEIHRCLWFETCKKCDCGELCRVFCESDNENFGGLRKITFARTQTLGTGGEMCDFSFSKTAKD